MSKLSEQLFHAFDIRIDSTLFTTEVATRLAHAEAYYFLHDLKVNSIVLSRDARESGSSNLELLSSLFSSFGFTVYLNPNPISTCLFYYSAMEKRESAGIMIGASHNPKSYTGQKLVAPYCTPIAKDGALGIIEGYFKEERKVDITNKGKIIFIDYKNQYLEESLEYLGLSQVKEEKLSLLVDFLSGSASNEIPYALKKLKINASYLNFIPNGSFPSGNPNPIISSSTVKTREALKQVSYDFALLYDGDGDRVDILDKNGVEITPSIIFAFILPYLDKSIFASKTVCLDPKASPLIHSYIASLGYNTFLVPNGHSKIKSILQEYKDEHFLFAVEESGHYYLNYFKDGEIFSIENTLIITLAFIKAYRENPQLLNMLIKLQESFIRDKEWGFFFKSREEREQALKTIASNFKEKGYLIQDKLKNGKSLESTLIKLNLPLSYSSTTKLDPIWLQIAQRASESELYLGRWELLSSSSTLLEEAKASIKQVLTYYKGKFYIG